MKNLAFISFGFMVALLMSVCLTSCSEDYGNGLTLPQKSEQPKDTTTTPTPQPQPTDEWSSYLRKYHKVFETAQVESYLIGQRGGKEINTTVLDSLTLRYKYVFSLAADTTLYLSTAPTGDISFTSAIDRTEYSEYSHNEQKDSVCFINYSKPYYLSNGVNLSLKTQRMRGWHMMGGVPVMYSEPNQSVTRLNITSETTEFEKNDSIFGLRTNICSVLLTLGDKQFTASATVKEVWFKAVKETPEPHFDIFVQEPVKHLASSMVEISTNNWKNVHLMTGKSQLHAIVCTTDTHNANVVAIEDKPVDLSRVVVNSQVNSAIYDAQTGLCTTSLISPDNTGWSWEGFIDGRSVTNDMGNARAIDEGIKNFMETNTSKPTPFFTGVKAEVTATWGEYEYTTITWTKYSKEGKAYTNTIVVKSPKKA